MGSVLLRHCLQLGDQRVLQDDGRAGLFRTASELLRAETLLMKRAMPLPPCLSPFLLPVFE